MYIVIKRLFYTCSSILNVTQSLQPTTRHSTTATIFYRQTFLLSRLSEECIQKISEDCTKDNYKVHKNKDLVDNALYYAL